ncbi:MAG: copper-containing nitrite reductase [Bacteroidetes bacterium]|nr:copper-containing nitrite reductase [Bacteroidota bacterium]
MNKLKNKKTVIGISTAIILIVAVVFLVFGFDGIDSNKVDGTEYAQLTYAPNVPQPVTRDHSTKVIVKLETIQITGRLADGVQYNFWTFGGKVPGEFIRVREGDEVEFHLENSPLCNVPHSIDLHAVSGPGGGASASQTIPGHASVFSFKAEHAGLYVYHCATQPVPLHIANGMYGLIYVQPKKELHPVDQEYYVMQSEFYTNGNYGDPGLQDFSLDKALAENPTYVVFNGSVGALSGENALQAKVGQTIRLFVGNIGPNLTSSFHIIGVVFDKVYLFGGTEVSQTNVQTVNIPAGGSAIVEFKVKVPGTFAIVDHSIFRAFNKGAAGSLVVTGDENKDIFSGKQSDNLFYGSNLDKEVQSGSNPNISANQAASSNSNIEDIVAAGKKVFSTTCFACHQPDGKGVPNIFPPLAGSDFLNANKERAIGIVLHGKTGPVTVNGKQFNNTMPPQSLTDDQIAAVLTYVYHSFGNSGKTVTKDDVTKVRGEKQVSLK